MRAATCHILLGSEHEERENALAVEDAGLKHEKLRQERVETQKLQFGEPYAQARAASR